MQTDPNTPRTDKKRQNEKRNFYIALSVCLLAAAAAAFSTFASVMDYLKTSEETLAQTDTSSAYSAPSAPVSSVPESSSDDTSTQDEETAATPSEEESTVEAAAYLKSDTFLPPCSGEITQPYSGDVLVYNETMRDWRTHPGCDISCESGEGVLACANGLVLETLTDPIWGNCIVIEHGNVILYYYGVGENFAVSEGDIVKQGEVIGTVSAVPCEAAKEAHLHMEAEQDGEAIDFAELLN